MKKENRDDAAGGSDITAESRGEQVGKRERKVYVIEHLEGEEMGACDFTDVSAAYQPRCLTDSVGSLHRLPCWDRVCLLDMDAPHLLKAQDAATFDFVVFGGILGNVPSDDRTSEVRAHNFVHRRHLGEMQMTTNTAVLVAKLILENRIEFEDIPFIDEPDVKTGSKEVTSLPFRYVSTDISSLVSTKEVGEGLSGLWGRLGKKLSKAGRAAGASPVFPKGFTEYLRQSGDTGLDFDELISPNTDLLN